MAEFAVTAIGADRPGIIARVTGVLRDRGGNLEDSSMTILGGQFAIMLLVSADDRAEELEAALAEATADLGLFVAVREVGKGHDSAPPTHVLSAYGTDRPGIVHGLAVQLAERGVNVTDLTTRLLEGERPVYAVMMEVSLPAGEDGDALARALAAEVDAVEVSIHPLDVTTF